MSQEAPNEVSRARTATKPESRNAIISQFYIPNTRWYQRMRGAGNALIHRIDGALDRLNHRTEGALERIAKEFEAEVDREQ